MDETEDQLPAAAPRPLRAGSTASARRPWARVLPLLIVFAGAAPAPAMDEGDTNAEQIRGSALQFQTAWCA